MYIVEMEYNGMRRKKGFNVMVAAIQLYEEWLTVYRNAKITFYFKPGVIA